MWQWLLNNHQQRESIWLVYYKLTSGKTDMSYSDIVDYCLCFGWIDSTKGTVDQERTKMRLSPRNPKSAWSKINKEKIAHLTKAGLIQPAGIAMVAQAKKNGAWTKLDSVFRGELPDDLQKAIHDNKLLTSWEKLSATNRRMALERLINMRGEETRNKAIKKIIDDMAKPS